MYRTDLTVENGNMAASIAWETDIEEYRVRLYKDNKAYPPADYFTDDREDAICTARHMVGLVLEPA